MFSSARFGLVVAALVLLSCASEASGASNGAGVDPTPQQQIDEAESLSPPAETQDGITSELADNKEEDDEMVTSNAPQDDDATPTSSPVDVDSANELATTDDQGTQPTAEAEPAPSPDPTPEPTATPQPCERLTDFTIDAENLSWFIVNDNVMGGRSSGGPTFTESAMVFEGEINTNGGGFSSVRIPLGTGTLTGFTELVVRARTDGRSYKLVLEDSLESRDRRVSQQGSLDFAATDEWQTARVSFADLEPKIFGRDVQTQAFRADLATQLGVMISDGVDGPFRIEIDWIDACR